MHFRYLLVTKLIMQPFSCIINVIRSSALSRRLLTISILGISVLLSGCASESASSPNSSSSAATNSESITLYSGRSEDLIAPLLASFTAETGIEVSVRYGESSEMAATILEEGENTKADVFLSQDAGALGAVTGEAKTFPFPEDVLNLVPAEYRAEDGSWVGVSGRARVLAYNPDLVTDIPKSVFDLADPGWKGRIAIAPTNASFQSFVTGMRVTEGDERTAEFLAAMKENAVFYEKNSQILDAVEDGEVAAGLLNHYYWFEKAAEIGNENMNSKISWFADGDAGNLVNVAGVSLLSDNPNALVFASWLLGETAQKYFLENTFEYSMTSDVAPDPSLPKLSEIKGPEIDLSDLSSLEQTLQLLSEAGLI
jgi:iron(III) transport system substrate-binding protein